MTKINDRYRECVSQVRKGGFCAYSFETFAACVELELLIYGDGPSDLSTSYLVTATGAQEADAWEARRAASQGRARAAGKARRQVMRDMGLNSRGE